MSQDSNDVIARPQCERPHSQTVGQADSPRLHGQPCSYRDIGVQTLPPPNGEVYQLLHGREPQIIDYAQLGLAAIGRFTKDPRSNPYDVIHSTTYTIPQPLQRRSCVDSGFQTAGYNFSKLALMKTKARASMMVNKYRKVAIQAGYTIYAETEDDLVVHSEQHVPTVRLDSEGNLHEGTVEGRYLPNIHGVLVHQRLATSHETAAVYFADHSHTARPPLLETRSPSSSLCPEKLCHQTLRQLPAFAPSLREQDLNVHSVTDAEYGGYGSDMERFVVHDAGTDAGLPTLTVKPDTLCDNDYKIRKVSRPLTQQASIATDSIGSNPQAQTPLLSSHNPQSPRLSGNAQTKHRLAADLSESAEHSKMAKMAVSPSSKELKPWPLPNRPSLHAATTKAESPTRSKRQSKHRLESAQPGSRPSTTGLTRDKSNPSVNRKQHIKGVTTPSADRVLGRSPTSTKSSQSEIPSRSQSYARHKIDQPQSKNMRRSSQPVQKRSHGLSAYKSTTMGSSATTHSSMANASTLPIESSLEPSKQTKRKRAPREPFAPYVPPAKRTEPLEKKPKS